eukprot:SAG11_NODE_18953_length_477_cov_1.208995_1_plen_57_part_10
MLSIELGLWLAAVCCAPAMLAATGGSCPSACGECPPARASGGACCKGNITCEVSPSW